MGYQQLSGRSEAPVRSAVVHCARRQPLRNKPADGRADVRADRPGDRLRCLSAMTGLKRLRLAHPARDWLCVASPCPRMHEVVCASADRGRVRRCRRWARRSSARRNRYTTASAPVSALCRRRHRLTRHTSLAAKPRRSMCSQAKAETAPSAGPCSLHHPRRPPLSLPTQVGVPCSRKVSRPKSCPA